jgi:hypothetical protein
LKIESVISVALKKRRASLADLLLLHLTRDLYPELCAFSLKLMFIYFVTLTAVLQTQPLQTVVE